LSAYLNALGNKALEGEAPPSRDQLLELKEALIEAMRTDLGS
jgi:hypothetical protein